MKENRLDSLQRLLFCVGLLTRVLIADDPVRLQREQMVRQQVKDRGIRDPAVLQAMAATPRHLFVPPNVGAMAYEDRPLPIGYGATISQPYIVALMTELLQPKKNQRVLEIGTGSGYQAAILAQLAAEVYTIEIVPELAESAARTLRALGYNNVTVRQGDGYEGWVEHAPFDRIIVTAAPLEIPATLIQQLANGGQLVAPEGPLSRQELIVLEKGTDGHIRRRSVTGVAFVPMRTNPK